MIRKIPVVFLALYAIFLILIRAEDSPCNKFVCEIQDVQDYYNDLSTCIKNGKCVDYGEAKDPECLNCKKQAMKNSTNPLVKCIITHHDFADEKSYGSSTRHFNLLCEKYMVLVACKHIQPGNALCDLGKVREYTYP